MKILFASLILICCPLHAGEIAAPEDKDDLEELNEISEDMDKMADALYDDRHDQTVQITGKVIDVKLENLKREIDVTVFRYTTLKGFHPSKRERILLKLAGYDTSNPGGDKDVKIEAGKTSAETLKNQKLDKAAYRPMDYVEIIQARYSSMPMRWKDRISAYFLSLAAEEAKWQNWSPEKKPKLAGSVK